MTKNDLFWKMVWAYRPEMVGFDPITIRANAQTPRELFKLFNAYAPAQKPGPVSMHPAVAAHYRAKENTEKDPSTLNEAAKRQLHINAVMMDETFIYMYALSDVMRRRFDAVSVQYGTPKGMIRSEQKIVDTSGKGYSGDARQLKDQVRCTVVVKQPLSEVKAWVIGECTEKNGLKVEKSNLDAALGISGYSDLNNVIRFPNEMFAEIQVNSMRGLYGKDSRKSWLKGTGQGESVYTKLSGEIGVEGGHGHKLYEIARDKGKPKDVRDEANTLSKEYYGHIMKGHGGSCNDLDRRAKAFITLHLGQQGPEAHVPPYNSLSQYQVSIYKLMEEQYRQIKVYEKDLVVTRPRR